MKKTYFARLLQKGRKWAGGAPHGSSEQDEVGGERRIRYEEGARRMRKGE